jgi:competence protein ComEA
MPTPSERRALLFLATLLVLGGAVRASAALRGGNRAFEPEADDARALARQISAVDSARREGGAKGRGKGRAPATPPRARETSGRSASRAAAAGTVTRSSAGRLAPSAPPVAPPPAPVTGPRGAPARIDVDVAPAADLERLPRIGPVLAERIVADRDSLGPFGSLEGLRRVRGVGPVVAKGIAPYVTFSLPPRPPRVVAPAHRVTARTGAGSRSRRAGALP